MHNKTYTNSHHQNHTKDLVYIALFAVLMAICSWISIPTVIPFTMQTFAVYLALDFLGGKKGTIAVCIYLLMGLIGLPVFSNFTSGLGVLLGAAGGYMMGWILSGLVMWALERLLGRKIWAQVLSMLTGLIVCYGTGTAWYVLVYGKNMGTAGIRTALFLCVIPFVIPDLIKLGMALWISQRLKKIG